MTERKIIIEEVGKPPVAEIPQPNGWDLQDGLICLGITCGEAAAWVIWWPAALILAAVFAFVFAYLIEISRSKAEKIQRVKEKRGAA